MTGQLTHGETSLDRKLVFSDCERRYLGWEKFKRWASSSVEVCSGFSTVSCKTKRDLRGARAWFCVFENLVETCPEDGGREWTAFCQMDKGFSMRDAFLSEFHDRSALRSGRIHFVDADPPDFRFTSTNKFTYLAAGDCGGGSPGHCIADHQQFFLVRELLGFRRDESTVIMESGFEKSVYVFNQTFKRGSIPSSDPRKLVRNASDMVYIEDWIPLAVKIEVGDEGKVCRQGEVYATAAISPHSMNSPHWRGFFDNPKLNNGSKDCQGKSQVLMDLREVISKHMEQL
eukprot:26067-Rhodomonas_salina.1